MTIATGEVTSLAFCWRIERRDGGGLGLTSHDRPLIIAGTTYRPAPAMTPASVRMGSGLDPQAGEVEGVLSAAALSTQDLESGRWDGARVALFMVDWQDPDGEQVALVGGTLGAVSIKDGSFAAELVGAADALSAPVCPETSPECRAELGDRSCRVDLAGRREHLRVIEAGDERVTFDRDVADRFLAGEALVLDGANGGWRSRVVGIEGATVVMRDVPSFAVPVGSRIRLTEGCDKSFATCRGRFANSANFRGEPHLPGNDLLTRYPGA